MDDLSDFTRPGPFDFRAAVKRDLGVPHSAFKTKRELKQAYMQQFNKLHPDKQNFVPGTPEYKAAEDRMRRMTANYQQITRGRKTTFPGDTEGTQWFEKLAFLPGDALMFLALDL